MDPRGDASQAQPTRTTGDSIADSGFARVDQAELLDGEDWTTGELARNLRDIRRVNRLGGGAAAILETLPALIGDGRPRGPITILDLATGSADIPLAVAGWADRRGLPVRITGSDLSPAVLEIARERTRGVESIDLTSFDARSIPLGDTSYDIVLCSLALHHFRPDDAVKVLGEMRRVCRRGFVVNDLVRSRAGWIAAVATSRLLTRNRLTRHDAPLSVRRAYTPPELRDLLERAGAGDAAIRRRPLFRVVAVWTRSG